MSRIPNVLAERYASEAIRSIWSPEGKIRLERELWIAVLKAQADCGLAVTPADIQAYEAVLDRIDLESIRERERISRHDVKARIDEFCALAGRQQIHKGLTSRDLTENVEQMQVYRSLVALEEKSAAALAALSRRALQWRNVVLTGRTHNVAAQLTTMGKRLAMFGEELLGAFELLRHLRQTYPVRGIKGAIGTQLDQLSLFGGDASRAAKLEDQILHHLALPCHLEIVGQVYPRSLDHRIVSALVDLGSGPASFAKTLRLMAGHETASEGFAPGQTGSSAMPHKMNSRSCERINGLHVILKGHLTMAAGLAGDQWNEGDVSCSVVRRVVLPDAFFASDGLLETFLSILQQMEVYPAVIERENAHYLPFLLSTTFLMEAVKAGAGREDAHKAIKGHALAAISSLRSEERAKNDFLDRLAQDKRVGLSPETLQAIVARGSQETGTAGAQVDSFVKRVEGLLGDYPSAARYQPEPIL